MKNQYKATSFFESDNEFNDYVGKLNNDKKVVVFYGNGANGKTTLANQLQLENPNEYVVHFVDDTFHMNSILENGKKTIFIINDKKDLEYLPKDISYDIVEFRKRFV